MEVGTMPRRRTSPESIIHKLREAEILISQGHTVGAVHSIRQVLSMSSRVSSLEIVQLPIEVRYLLTIKV